MRRGPHAKLRPLGLRADYGPSGGKGKYIGSYCAAVPKIRASPALEEKHWTGKKELSPQKFRKSRLDL